MFFCLNFVSHSIFPLFSKSQHPLPNLLAKIMKHIQAIRIFCQLSKFCWLYLQKNILKLSTFLQASYSCTDGKMTHGSSKPIMWSILSASHGLSHRNPPWVWFALTGFPIHPWTNEYGKRDKCSFCSVLGHKPILEYKGEGSYPKTTWWLRVAEAVEKVVGKIVGIDRPRRRWEVSPNEG